jgi:uroporphyrinogen-III synthase
MQAVSAEGDVGDLTALVRAQAVAGPLLYPRGAVTRGDIAAALRDAGVVVRSVVLYDQAPAALSGDARALFQNVGRIVLPLFSPRSAHLVGSVAAHGPAHLHIVAMSQAVADAWTGPAPRSMTVPRNPDTQAMLTRIAEIYLHESS